MPSICLLGVDVELLMDFRWEYNTYSVMIDTTVLAFEIFSYATVNQRKPSPDLVRWQPPGLGLT